MKRILDRAPNLSYVDDDVVADYATELAACISKTTFDLGLLCRAVQFNMTLRRWGFEEALSDDEVFNRAKDLVDGDIEDVYRKVHREYVVWYEEWPERYSVLNDLD